MKVHSGKFKRHKYYMRYCSMDGAKHLDVFKCVNPNHPIIDIVSYGEYCLGKTMYLSPIDSIPRPSELYITKNYDKKRCFINLSGSHQLFYELTQDEFLMQVLGETI